MSESAPSTQSGEPYVEALELTGWLSRVRALIAELEQKPENGG